MNNIFQKGVPLTVTWKLNKPDGGAFDISGLRLRLFYTCANRQGEVPSFATSGNPLQWVFTADKQVHSGDYSLRLVIYQYNQLICTLYYLNAFALSSAGTTAGIISQQTDEGNFLALQSVAEFYKFAPVIPVVGQNGNWFINGEDTGISVAFDIEGYATTEQLNEVREAVEGLGDAMDGKMAKGEDTYNGNIAEFDPQGNVRNSGKKVGDFLTEHQDISHLASKAELQSAIAAVVGIQFVEATAPLPTPTAQTGGKIYLLPITGTTNHTMWVTVEDNNSYAWLQLGASTIDVSGKADKVPTATEGNFAEFDATGNIKDSGKKKSDFLTQHQDISGKADKVPSGNGYLAEFDSNGNIKSSGKKKTDFLTEHQDISGKMDRVPSATSGNLAVFDSQGNVVDSNLDPEELEPGEVDLSNYYTRQQMQELLAQQSAAIIAEIENHSTAPAEEVDSSEAVIFIDYDGTVLYAYSATQFAQLENLPAIPTHSGLRAEGWNWTLARAQDYVAAHGRLTIGMCYCTDDNKTRLYINLTDAEFRTVPLRFGQLVSEAVQIDWGDGSAVETVQGTGDVSATHTYASVGNYVITMWTGATNWIILGNRENSTTNVGYSILGYYLDDYQNGGPTPESRMYRDSLKKVELGYHVRIGAGAFKGCRNMKTITISSYTEFYSFPYSAGQPTPQYNVNQAFHDCISLKALVFSSGMPVLYDSLLRTCAALQFISLNYGFTEYAALPYAYKQVDATSLEGCSSLKRVEIPEGPTNIAVCDVIALEYLRVPSSTTHIIISGNPMLHDLNSLPASLVEIVAEAFKNDALLRSIHLLSPYPPTLADTNAFTGMPSNYRIYVPQSASHVVYERYRTNPTNWSWIASHIYEEGGYQFGN